MRATEPSEDCRHVSGCAGAEARVSPLARLVIPLIFIRVRASASRWLPGHFHLQRIIAGGAARVVRARAGPTRYATYGPS